MKKFIFTTLLLGVIGYAVADPGPVPYGNVATANSAAGTVNSQSAATANSYGTGTAFSATQSGSFSSYGQIGTYLVAPTGQLGGTANVAGFTSTSEYVTSQSMSTGTGTTAANSWNSANASTTSFVSAIGNGITGYTGAATGNANSHSAGAASTASSGNQFAGVIVNQGNTGNNVSQYTAGDSVIQSTSTVTVNNTVVPVTNVQTQTSAYALSNSNQVNESVYSNGDVANTVGAGSNTVTNTGTATAVGN